MGRCLILPLLLFGACKAQLGGTDVSHDNPDAPRPIDGAVSVDFDAAVDGAPALGPWGTPAKIPGADGTLAEEDATLSSNKLEIYFKRTDADSANLYVMTRASEAAAWSAPAAVTILNTTTLAEESPRLSKDDLTIYFGRGGDIFKSTRASTTSPWGTATAVTTLNTTADTEKWAAVCDSGYTIISRSTAANGQDLFEGTLATGATTALTGLNSTVADQGTLLSADCLQVYFQSNRDNAQFDIYMSSRATTSSPWGAPQKLTDFNTTTNGEEDPWISTDQRTFVFTSNASGNKDVYISTR